MYLKVVKYLDVELLPSAYMTANSNLQYIKSGSNFPETAIKDALNDIECRLSKNVQIKTT